MQTEEALLNARLGSLYSHITRILEVYEKTGLPQTAYGTKIVDLLRVNLIPQVWLSPKFVPTVIGAVLKKPFEAITDCPKHNLLFRYRVEPPVTRARLAYSPTLAMRFREEQDFDLSGMLVEGAALRAA